MEDNKESLNLAYAKNLNTQNFNCVLNVAIDSNVNIKTLLNINSYIFDEKIECANGKAVISGKIGVKILYIDTDNITNTITDSQPFSETIIDSSITNDCFINMSNICVLNNNVSIDGNLKLECSVSFTPILYLNLGLSTASNMFNNMITKKDQINTHVIANKINTYFNYNLTFETKDNINKVLCHCAYFSPQSTTSNDGYLTVEGCLYSTLVYETTYNEEPVIKCLSDCFNIKTDVEISTLTSGSILDLSFFIDKNAEMISTDVEDNNSVVTISNKIVLKGVELKEISIDVFEDMYSTQNEVELSYTNRDYIYKTFTQNQKESINHEFALAKEDPAIEEVISNLNIFAETTNCYVKNGTFVVEGVISSTIVYLDENKEYKQKDIVAPFVIDTKLEQSKLFANNTNVSVCNCRLKVRRGTMVEIEYDLNVNTCTYCTNNKNIVNNVTIGKELDFSSYDYQIYIAKPEETLWSLAKRVKVLPESLNECNSNLPSEFTGGEKIIIKR